MSLLTIGCSCASAYAAFHPVPFSVSTCAYPDPPVAATGYCSPDDRQWICVTQCRKCNLPPDHASCSTSPAQLHSVIKGHVGASVRMWVNWSTSEEDCKLHLRGCERWRTAPALLRDSYEIFLRQLHVDQVWGYRAIHAFGSSTLYYTKRSNEQCSQLRHS